MRKGLCNEQNVSANAPKPPTASLQDDVEVEVRRIVRKLCPTCGEAFQSDEQAKEHWLAAHAPHSVQPASEQTSVQPNEMEVKVVIKRKCPSCDETFATDDEAKEHWLATHFSKPASTNEASAAESQSSDVAMSKAQLIEADEKGQPVIVRYKDPESGVARTVVTNEDGSQRAFGEETLKTLLAEDDASLSEWLAAMTERCLRGLVNEMSERFIQISNVLFDHQQEFQHKSRHQALSFFGLEDGCREKDLDNAYRRLARSMHPDKNGGTDEAKENFQAMKTKYEELKELCEDGILRPISPTEPEEAKPAKVEETKKNDEAKPASKKQLLYCRSHDRTELSASAKTILSQLKVLKQNLSRVQRDFEKMKTES